MLPEGPCFYPEDMYTDQTERIMAAEIIREKILQLTREEVPHAVAVQVKEMKTRENGTVYVLGDIYVERDSQKAILIGRKGSMLKKISSEARMDIEKLTEDEYYVRGCTALLDAIGRAVHHIGNVHKYARLFSDASFERTVR